MAAAWLGSVLTSQGDNNLEFSSSRSRLHVHVIKVAKTVNMPVSLTVAVTLRGENEEVKTSSAKREARNRCSTYGDVIYHVLLCLPLTAHVKIPAHVLVHFHGNVGENDYENVNANVDAHVNRDVNLGVPYCTCESACVYLSVNVDVHDRVNARKVTLMTR